MKQLLLTLLTASSIALAAQTTFKKHTITSGTVQVIDPKQSVNDFQAQLINLEMPSPDGDSYRSFLMRQKIKVREAYPQQPQNVAPQKTNALPPTVNDGLGMYYYYNNRRNDVWGGIPNDNTLAVSNSGLVLCAINSITWAYNSNTDTTHYEDGIKSLKAIGGGSNSDNNFDPKLMYDPVADRWILVYLQNNTPSNSRIKVCFSSTNDPEDPWYSYVLPGNPLNNNRWTDFPAISMTDDELFITVNLIIPNVSWQVGFDGSVIWQIDKMAGFAGDSTLTNTLWSDIKFGTRFLRNLHPVWGTEGAAPEAFFLSNRNFDITNDSIFVLQLDGKINDPNATLNISVSQTTPNYGVPPNGRQQDTDLNDPLSGLQTNDARVLGAITNGEWIQFVANTVVPATGYAGIYHGTVTNLHGQPVVSGNIISHPTRDFGYPNIASVGNENCDTEALIGFNFTSPTEFPGVCTMYYGNDGTYSPLVDLKAGENYTDRHAADVERWGDYFGMQRKYNEPQTAWLAGYYGNSKKQNATWVAEVKSADTAQLRVQVNHVGSALFCSAYVSLLASGGTPPYQYSFNNEPFSSKNNLSGLCEGLTIPIKVLDARGCEFADTIIITKTIAPNQPASFPNPFNDRIVVQFSLPQDQNLTAAIFDETGREVETILDQPAKAGDNELRFWLRPLRQGIYFLRIEGSAGFLYTEKLEKFSE
jgi:hypothetical protein